MPPLPISKTPAQLATDAASQIEAEIGGELAPYAGQVEVEQGRKERAAQELEKVFSSVQPFVSASAQRVTEAGNAAQGAIKGVYDTAFSRISELKQSRAAEAQALAQQIGGPVAVGEFTAGVESNLATMPMYAAGDQLHSIANAGINTDLAESFAGKVFPLIRVEEELKTRQKFDEEIRTIQARINAIKATKAGRVNARLNELQLQERNYELQRANQQLEKLKADRDWKATKQQLNQQKAQAGREKQRMALERAGLLGYIERRYKDKKGKWRTERIPTLAGRETSEGLTTSVAARTGYNPDTGTPTPTTRGQQIQAAELKQDWLQGQRDIRIANEDRGVQLIDAFMSPQPKEVKVTKYSPVGKEQRDNMDPEDVAALIRDPGPDGKFMTKDDMFYSSREVTETIEGQALTDANDVYRELVANNIPKNIARQLVMRRFGINNKDWKPGSPWRPRPKDATSDSPKDRPRK